MYLSFLNIGSISNFCFVFLIILGTIATSTTAEAADNDVVAVGKSELSFGPARTSCNADYSAPCSRVNSKWLAIDTSMKLSQRLVEEEEDVDKVFHDLTYSKKYNYETKFYPYIYHRNTSKCVAHGLNPKFVGLTLEEIFNTIQIAFTEFTSIDEVHQRFVTAAFDSDNNNKDNSDDDDIDGDWVQYLWREQVAAAANNPIVHKIAYVTNLTQDYYLGVGYIDNQLPLDLPCSDKTDSWCSINNVRSLVGKAQTLLEQEVVSNEQFETALWEISFNHPEYVVTGGHYLFMYHYDGPLMAHAHLNRFVGQNLTSIFTQLKRDADEGTALHEALRAGAEGDGDGWVQYQWKNKVDEPEYTKIAYVVKIEFNQELYYLGCGFNFIIGDVVEYTTSGGGVQQVDEEDEEDEKETEDETDENEVSLSYCPDYNLPCRFGRTLQLTSHTMAHLISTPFDDVDELFKAITYSNEFQIGFDEEQGEEQDSEISYAFAFDFNGTCVAHGNNPNFVGKSTQQILEESSNMVVGLDGDYIHTQFKMAAELGGGYVLYDWVESSKDDDDEESVNVVENIAYIFQVTLVGRNYYAGVAFKNERAPIMPNLDTGTQLSGDPIPCSSQYGSICSEVTSQSIIGQALADLILSSSETKTNNVRNSIGNNNNNNNLTEVLQEITNGNDLYRVQDFYVSVFAVDQTLCYTNNDELQQQQGLNAAIISLDNSGCCIAHGRNPDYVGMTWQDILDTEYITSIRGTDLHNRLIGQTDVGGHWTEYSWASSTGGAQIKRAFSSRFKDGDDSYYVVVEYYQDIPPITCDACPSDMECTEPNQYFCEPKPEETPWYQSKVFIILTTVLLGVPSLGVIFYWIGKKKEERQAKAQIQEIGQKMQSMSQQIETEKKSASRAHKLLSSLFPKQVHDRIMEQIEEEEGDGSSGDVGDSKRSGNNGIPEHITTTPTTAKDRMNDYLKAEEGGINDQQKATASRLSTTTTRSKPIADLFPQATISFADIVGFTAWSSTRDPSQVFTLLETIYQAFDKIAKRLSVFKVETVGDCYVAVAGLPDRRDDHATVMVKFAAECLTKFCNLVAQLEVELGPGTGDLGLRSGLHSGPVTAGVLRGERGRFQLFGDTVNTAARMESLGAKNRIHLSQELVDLLLEAGKSHWASIRDDEVDAKGKGILRTYWLEEGALDLGCARSVCSGATDDSSLASGHSGATDDHDDHRDANAAKTAKRSTGRQQKLVEWNTNILKAVLVDVVSRRTAGRVNPDSQDVISQLEKASLAQHTSLEQVKEIVSLPEFNPEASSHSANVKTELNDTVLSQLHAYIDAISEMYNENPFHNFQHATHVTMSVVKLMSRIVAPSELPNSDHSYGMKSDPLTQFSVLLSALIHDIDHPGVPNSQLVKEGSELTTMYSQSLAELNSLDLAWVLLMKDEFSELRKAIYSTEAEFKRFRQLMINIVLATDIIDKDLKKLRNDRWDAAFQDGNQDDNDNRRAINRKATIVIEHLIQASDVAHTMQHWSVYIKWNKRFFFECYDAYKAGRAEKDPSEGWYKGELGFFDFYIIPLAKKLKDCQVFGVSSDEYLRYAEQNRQEWEAKGRDIVADYVESCSRDGPDGDYFADLKN